MWYDQAWVEVLDETYIGSPAAVDANPATRTLHFRARPEALLEPPYKADAVCNIGDDGKGANGEGEDVEMSGTLALFDSGLMSQEKRWQADRDAWRHGKFAHTLVSVAGVERGAQGHTLSTTFYFLNAALLHGRWYLLPESTGSFANVSCYARHGGMPGVHPSRKHMPHEDEADELAERHRPRSLSDCCFMILGGPWVFEHCDVVCYDGTALALCHSDAHANMSRCLLGAAGFVGRLANGSWAVDHCEGRARIGVEMEGAARLELADSLVQLTDFAGIRMDDTTHAQMRGCRFEHNGLLGGAAISLARAASARLSNCSLVCGKSVSPTFPRVAAFEAAVSARSQAVLELVDLHCEGRLWLHQHRPRSLKLCNVSALEPLEDHDLGGTRRDGRAMAVADGISDPILLWGTGYHQIWWSEARLKKIGLEFTELPEDAYGQVRCAPEQEVVFQDTDKEDDVVWGNRKARVRLHEWGWEGSLCDVFDTQSDAVMAVHEGVWQPWENMEEQIENRFRSRFKKSMHTMSEARAAAAAAFVELFDTSAGVRKQAALKVPELCARGDLAACFWLQRAEAAEDDAKVRAALAEARQRVEIGAAEARTTAQQLRQQLAQVRFDQYGAAPGQQLMVGDTRSRADGGNAWRIPVDSLPPAIRCAVYPLAPLYPQCQDTGGVPMGQPVAPLPPLRLRRTWYAESEVPLQERAPGGNYSGSGIDMVMREAATERGGRVEAADGAREARGRESCPDDEGHLGRAARLAAVNMQVQEEGQDDEAEAEMEEEAGMEAGEEGDRDKERKRLRRKHGVWSRKHNSMLKRGFGRHPAKIIQKPLDGCSLGTRTRHLTCAERYTLAHAGYGTFPSEEEIVREIKARTVDEQFRILSLPQFEEAARDLISDYADQMRINVPNITALRLHRKQLEKEHSVTRDYFHALRFSPFTRSLHPHLHPTSKLPPPRCCFMAWPRRPLCSSCFPPFPALFFRQSACRPWPQIPEYRVLRTRPTAYSQHVVGASPLPHAMA